MKSKAKTGLKIAQPPASGSDLLLLPDGRLLVHNLTPAMAELLRQLNPDDQTLRKRAELSADRQETIARPVGNILSSHELPN
jgi:hypothetical protein